MELGNEASKSRVLRGRSSSLMVTQGGMGVITVTASNEATLRKVHPGEISCAVTAC